MERFKISNTKVPMRYPFLFFSKRQRVVLQLKPLNVITVNSVIVIKLIPTDKSQIYLLYNLEYVYRSLVFVMYNIG